MLCIRRILYSHSYGPKQLRTQDDTDYSGKGKLKCELRYASFAADQHTTDQWTTTEREMSVMVEDALTPAVLLVRLLMCIRLNGL